MSWVKSKQVRSVEIYLCVLNRYQSSLSDLYEMYVCFRHFILTSILLIYKVKRIYCWERNNWKWLHASWALPDQVNQNNLGGFEAALIKMHWSLEDDSGRRGRLVSSSDKLLSGRRREASPGQPNVIPFSVWETDLNSHHHEHEPWDASGNQLMRQVRMLATLGDKKQIEVFLW